MHPYATIRPGIGFQLGRALGYYGQRLVTAQPVRRLVVAFISRVLRLRYGRGPSTTLSPAMQKVLADLRAEGAALMEPTPIAVVDSMVDYFRSNKVVDLSGAEVALEDLPAGATAANYPLETVLDCPGLLSVINSPAILKLAEEYLGCRPTISSVGVRWSFPNSASTIETQQFHRDLDDWRFFKLFIYLCDVDQNSGPHTYVKTTHLAPHGLKSKFYDLGELKAQFGRDRVWTVTGPRGTTFVADTQGIHRGDIPMDRARLILQVQYSLLPIFAFRYEPVKRAMPAVDAYINRLILALTGI